MDYKEQKELIELQHKNKLEEIELERKARMEVEKYKSDNDLAAIRLKNANIMRNLQQR